MRMRRRVFVLKFHDECWDMGGSGGCVCGIEGMPCVSCYISYTYECLGLATLDVTRAL